MSITYTKKVGIQFHKQDEPILDGQSKICNWLYNKLLDDCKDDYENNNNEKELLSGRNLRDHGVSLKEKYPFLKTVFSSVLKEPATRLKLAYEGFFSGQRGYPHYRSWKGKWFSLVYDEPDKGWEVCNNGRELAIALGQIPDMPKEKGCRNPYIKGKLKEKVSLKSDEMFKTCSIVKQHGKFYAIFVIERCSQAEFDFKEQMTAYRKECNTIKKANEDKEIQTEKIKQIPKPKIEEKIVEPPKDCKWCAIDPNHKNFFVLVDYKGNNIEFSKLDMIKYWDKTIDKLKSKRDVCQKHYRKHKTQNGNTYAVHSPRWNRINKALEKAYDARREQIKSALYSIAYVLYERYDLVMIGDYVPDNNTAKYKNMKRSMLNQEEIGKFRKTLEWVAQKAGKFYQEIDEANTTKKCCICGFEEKKDPSVRKYTCPKCGSMFMRDSGSAVNIANKGGYQFDLSKYKDNLTQFTHKGSIRYSQKAKIIKV